jgi:hypothetical protein
MRYDFSKNNDDPVRIMLPIIQDASGAYILPTHTYYISMYNNKQYAYCCAHNSITQTDVLLIYDISLTGAEAKLEVVVDFTELYKEMYKTYTAPEDVDIFHMNGITVFEYDGSRYCVITLKKKGDCFVIKDPLPDMINIDSYTYSSIVVCNIFGNYNAPTNVELRSIHNVYYSKKSHSLTIFHNHDPIDGDPEPHSQIIQYPLSLKSYGGLFGLPTGGARIATEWEDQWNNTTIVDLDFYTAHFGSAKPIFEYKMWIVACGEEGGTYSGDNISSTGTMMMVVKSNGDYMAYNTSNDENNAPEGFALYDCFTYFDQKTLDMLEVNYD